MAGYLGPYLGSYAGMSLNRVVWEFFSSRPEVRAGLRLLIQRRMLPTSELTLEYLKQQIAGNVVEALAKQVSVVELGTQVAASSAEFICLVHTAETQIQRLYANLEAMTLTYYNNPWKKEEGTVEDDGGELSFTTDKRIERTIDGLTDLAIDSIGLFVTLLDLAAFLKKPADTKLIRNLPQNVCQIYDAVQKWDDPASLKLLGYGQEQFATAKEDLSKIQEVLKKTQEALETAQQTVENVVGKEATKKLAQAVTTFASIFWESTQGFFAPASPPQEDPQEEK
ncbi:MAG: hypothetical protein K940chlam8_00391 [Chlamydiae bacterium]|nr:hypothetical protein [Chlamydiota bacterium]